MPWKLNKPKSLMSRSFNKLLGHPTEVYCWEDWHRDNKSKYPVRYFLQETVPDEISYWISRCRQLKNWLRSRTIRRHHILNLCNKANNHEPGYCDVREKILYANFALLAYFLENDNEAKIVDWEGSPEHALVYGEMWVLHRWFNEERPAAWDVLNGYGKGIYESWTGNQWFDYENALEDKDDEMLGRLLKIRRWLWS